MPRCLERLDRTTSQYAIGLVLREGYRTPCGVNGIAPRDDDVRWGHGRHAYERHAAVEDPEASRRDSTRRRRPGRRDLRSGSAGRRKRPRRLVRRRGIRQLETAWQHSVLSAACRLACSEPVVGDRITCTEVAGRNEEVRCCPAKGNGAHRHSNLLRGLNVRGSEFDALNNIGEAA